MEQITTGQIFMELRTMGLDYLLPNWPSIYSRHRDLLNGLQSYIDEQRLEEIRKHGT